MVEGSDVVEGGHGAAVPEELLTDARVADFDEYVLYLRFSSYVRVLKGK